jgi:hypothetical protein
MAPTKIQTTKPPPSDGRAVNSPTRETAAHSLVVRFREFEASGNGWGIVAVVVIVLVLGGVAIVYKLL